jgi:hypothetical protein
MAARLGSPAVNDPREFTLREVQQVVANVRERLRIIDSTLANVQLVQQVGTQTSATQFAAMQKQLTALAQALAALTAVVAALESDDATDPRTEQIAGELLALQTLVAQLGDPDPGRLPQLEAVVGQLQQQVEQIDTVGQTPLHAALLQRLQDRVDDLNRSYLV